MPTMHIRHAVGSRGGWACCITGNSRHHPAVADTARKTIEQDNCIEYPGNGRAVGSEKIHGG